MTHTAKHTPGPPTEDIMMFFDLSDEDWDGLTGRMQDQLRDAYISHTDPVRAAAPAMYEAGRLSLDVMERVAAALKRMGNKGLRSIVRSAIIEQKAALAQAEGKQ